MNQIVSLKAEGKGRRFALKNPYFEHHGGIVPKGKYQTEYFQNPRVHELRSKKLIFEDVDAFSMEYFEDEPEFHEKIDFVIVLPPWRYEGIVTKGIFFSQSVDFIDKLFPQVRELFHSIANSQWGAVPWSRQADGLFALYENEDREAWFRGAYPERSNKKWLPLQDADFTNEYKMGPVPPLRFDHDVICVSRLHDLKNIPLIAAALKVHKEKYYPIRMALVLGKDVQLGMKGLNESEANEWRQIEEILVHPFDYISIVPQADHYKELPELYSRSKVCVLGSLFEGKNRSLHEAMCCNTPVVCFEQYNQYIRGAAPVMPEGAGVYAKDFSVESMADAINEVISNREQFQPRKRYLENSGRKNFFNRCLDVFQRSYEGKVPGLATNAHFSNLWLDLAIQDNYQLSLNDFVYGRNPLISHVQGISAIRKMLDFYFCRFGLRTTS